MNPEFLRLEAAYRAENKEAWLRWGPYLSERAWATVREDYSANGDAWTYFPHDHARSRAYRWNEDGLCGISGEHQILCLAFAFWNGADPFLKERLFGVTGPQGNHGEDVKEVYAYLESTPTHSYMAMNYKYPQRAFPYEALVRENQRRDRKQREYELWDTGIFAEGRYFGVDVAYAKAAPTDIHVEVRVTNRGPEAAPFHLLPTLWFRNTWSWGRTPEKPEVAAGGNGDGPWLEATINPAAARAISSSAIPGVYRLHVAKGEEAEPLLTENETNAPLLFGSPSKPGAYYKDAFHEYVAGGRKEAVNPARTGTKGAFHFQAILGPGETRTWRLRLREGDAPPAGDPLAGAEETFAARRAECDRYYRDIEPEGMTDAERQIHRQALAGMLWSKQFYHFVVRDWIQGDPGSPPPPPERSRLGARNVDWQHLHNDRVMSMPDKWEYPWYASWDLAFHCLPLTLADPAFAKGQLDLLMREWYQHPNGQIPAYEWDFGDVNPPVYAWACWRVYKMDKKRCPDNRGDRDFLETAFHKLMLCFNWWVNRKDAAGRNIFQGGFLGLDNIGVFDRSKPLPGGGHLEQSDGTSWMGLFALNMVKIALELAIENPVYENIATKFFEHFMGIAEALNELSGEGRGLWDEQDQFFYDVLRMENGDVKTLRVRSLVGLLPLLAVETAEPKDIARFPGFRKRLEWYLQHRPDLASLVSHWQVEGDQYRRLFALVRGHRMKRLLARMLDPDEFLSEYGIRSLSKAHLGKPFLFACDGKESRVDYEPGESETYLFGGNSNWRGPVWLPVNYLLIESLQKFHHYYGDDFKVECPTGSGTYLTLDQIADELSRRLIRLFEKRADGTRPYMGPPGASQREFLAARAPDQVWFHEYFHGDTGEGLGAAHQTGWTGLIAKLIDQQARKRKEPREP